MPILSDPARLSGLLAELDSLTTESGRDADDLESLSTLELVRQMNEGDRGVAEAVRRCSSEIAEAVDGIAARLHRGGRLIYLGAGTAGRLGILDASEIPPTFGADPSQVVGLIAGGSEAVRQAVEDAEDDEAAAAAELAKLRLAAQDVVVGVSASGRTPYVVGGMEYARRVGAMTIALSQNAGSMIGGRADIRIEVVVGPEFLAGSTRLKAGTAQKLVLNMLSTLAMVRLGKTYRGVMVDLVATNEKLRARSVRIVMTLTGASMDAADAALAEASGQVKVAILSLLGGMSAMGARTALAAAGDSLREAVGRSSR